MTEAGQILEGKAEAQPQVQQPTAGEVLGEAKTDDQPKVDPLLPKEDRISSKLELLIRREQAAVARERAAKEKELELEEKLKRIEEFESSKGNSKKALELLGLNYDELTKSMLSDGNIPPEVQIKKMDEKFNRFVEEQKRAELQREEDAKRAAAEREGRAIDNFKTEINTYLKDNAAKYELIHFEGQEDLVYEVIDEHYKRTLDEKTGIGKVMSIEEAAEKVEQHLTDKYDKSRNINKVKQLWAAGPKAVQSAIEQIKKAQQQPQQKTLTNQAAASQQKPRTKPLTDEERVQRAIAYARGLRPQL